MDEGTREGRPAVETDEDQQDKSPEELREDIAQTREELGDTVETLAGKADVKPQAKEKAASAKQAAQQKKDEFVSKAKASSPEGAEAGAQQVATKAKQNPVPLAVAGGFLAGFIIGRRTSR